MANPAIDIFPFRTNICEGCEGSEASTEKTYQQSDSNLQREMDDNLLNYKLKERHTHPGKPSQPSRPPLKPVPLSTSNLSSRGINGGYSTNI